MPSRRDIFSNSGIYHVFNKTIDHINIFQNNRIAQLFLDLLVYYRSINSTMRYSYFRKLLPPLRTKHEEAIFFQSSFRIEVLAYCIMPNHFHLLLRQKLDGGIMRCMADVLNSITRFYNIRNNRKGPLFLPQFRSRNVVSRPQLIHVSRYIHLNPYSGGFVNNTVSLSGLPFVSFGEYVTAKTGICNTEFVMSEFGNDKNHYKKFVENHAEYQKTLEHIKYMKKWQ